MSVRRLPRSLHPPSGWHQSIVVLMETTIVTPEASVESYVTDQDIPFLLLSLVLKTCTTRSNDKREVTHRRFSLLSHRVSATGCRLRLYLLPSQAIANSILEPSFDRIFNDQVPSVTFDNRRPGFLHLDRCVSRRKSLEHVPRGTTIGAERTVNSVMLTTTSSVAEN